MMRTIMVTLDSLNRHFLSVYGASEVETPTIDGLAREGIVFENHFTASAPCMPARREFMTGTLELRHRSWGPLEPFDDPLPARLARAGSRSMLITDHYHYFEQGGENYHTSYTGYEFIRGHEEDNWKTFDTDAPPIANLSQTAEAYERAVSLYRSMEDFPCFRTFEAAHAWLDENRATDNVFLYIDEFDPHEPFFAPDEYLRRYDDSGYSGARLDWPIYGRWNGSAQQLSHVRNRYRAKVRFLDDLLGRFLDHLRDVGWYDDTTIIFTTDHGHYLGDHGWIGKPPCDNFNTLFNIPLIIKPAHSLRAPGGRRVESLTSLPDLCATISDLHGGDTEQPMYGRSLMPIVRGEVSSVRDYVLYGYYGAQLGYCDGDHTFLKTPPGNNETMMYYTTRLSAHPGHTAQLQRLYRDAPARTIVPHLRDAGIDYPLLRFPLTEPIIHSVTEKAPDTLYDLREDREQLFPIRDPERLREYRQKLAGAMQAEGFPPEELSRLGVT